MNSLASVFFCFNILIVVVVFSNGLSLASSPYPSRYRRQSDQPSENCKRPDIPENGYYLLTQNTSLAQEYFPLNTVLVYKCNKYYALSQGSSLMACLADGWSSEPPTCLKTCAPLYGSASTKVSCFDESEGKIECDQATDGAVARFSCAKFHESNVKHRNSIYCRDGSWNAPPIQCIPVCGKKSLPAEFLRKRSLEVPVQSHPWATAIFKKTDTGIPNICAGTMLSPRIIMTAAHCVSDSNGDSVDPSNLVVAVGKRYIKYKDERDPSAQYSDVREVVIHPHYKGEAQHFHSDIAFLVTKDTLVLTKSVLPVCYSNLPYIHLNKESRGEISGWSYPITKNFTSSEMITAIPILYMDNATCHSELPPDFLAKYYSHNKICAGYHDDGTVPCPKPSGNGLVFKNPEDGLYYVHGILSLGPRLETSRCGTSTTSLYTKVAVYYDMLDRIVSKYE